MNRKEANPIITVKRIKKILNYYGLNVIEKDINYVEGFWYSIRLEIVNLQGVGSNGKGITIEYARASAYAELMERIQSGTLIHKMFYVMKDDKDKKVFSKNECEIMLKKIGADYIGEITEGYNLEKQEYEEMFSSFKSKFSPEILEKLDLIYDIISLFLLISYFE